MRSACKSSRPQNPSPFAVGKGLGSRMTGNSIRVFHYPIHLLLLSGAPRPASRIPSEKQVIASLKVPFCFEVKSLTAASSFWLLIQLRYKSYFYFFYFTIALLKM